MDLTSYVAGLRARAVQRSLDRKVRLHAMRARLPDVARTLAVDFGVTRVVAFGSVVTGDFDERSDLDLAVAGLAVQDYWRALDMACIQAGVQVDLVRLEEAPASLRQVISQEGEVLLA